MELDSDAEMPSAGPSGGAGKVCEKKRFEVKKWSAVALWAWDIVVDNCAICRNHIMDLCIECQANQVSQYMVTIIHLIHNLTRPAPPARSAPLHGECATTHSTSTASPGKNSFELKLSSK